MPAANPDILVIGAGAAGMMAALAARGAVASDGSASAVAATAPRVLLVDGSARVGLKILVSGGGRCNVTNEQVSEADFVTDAPHLLRGTLRAFGVSALRAFFESRGCPLYAEPLGKLFPVSDRARDVLGVLLTALEGAGVELVTSCEIVRVQPDTQQGFVVTAVDGRVLMARRVILATGGQSLPRTGSRGFGFAAAQELGHSIVPPLPALTPIWLAPGSPLAGLSGITVPAILSLAPAKAPAEQVAGAHWRPLARAAGSLLVTHRGLSGPAALDVSGALARSLAAGDPVVLRGDFWTLGGGDSPWRPYAALAKPPGASLPSESTPRPASHDEFVRGVRASGAATLLAAAQTRMPKRLASALLAAGQLDGERRLDEESKEAWQRAWLALAHGELVPDGHEGFAKAEVTSGGVRLAELERVTLESKHHRGLFFCGEVVNVTGRLGGFNFQWAWSSGYAAGLAATRSIAR
jgi:predicted Rossmann fold flavoprotein